MNKKKTNVAQWADHSLNIQRGCSNSCYYCYAEAISVRNGITSPEGWGQPVIDPKSFQKIFPKRSGVTMFPTMHDITPQNIETCLVVLKNLLSPGNDVLIVSKPNFECIETLCDELENYKSQIEFRFTIGSVDQNVLKFWEPNAPSLSERIQSLKYAHSKGFKTSISCEPMLDNHPEKVVKTVESFVTETIWLGKANDLIRRLKINHHNDQTTLSKAAQLIAWQSDNKILELYNKFNCHPKIRWKDSIEEVVRKSQKNKEK